MRIGSKECCRHILSFFDLPEGAREENITVYRACKTWKCDKESFTPTFEEQGCRYLEGDDPKDPGLYSLSTTENIMKNIKEVGNNGKIHGD